MALKPHLSFFCELEAQPLQALFSDPQLIQDLQSLEAGISLGMLDLNDERAEVVRSLSRAGIPVIAWLLLPKEQGYWFNLDNAPQAVARYAEFQRWSADKGLAFAGVGLDIEPDINLMSALLRDWQTGLRLLLPRLLNSGQAARAAQEYRCLVERICADGYFVESYQFPSVADERKAGSKALQHLFRTVDLPVDREVFMLYTSFFRPYGAAILASYAPDADAIGVGNAGGGVQIEGVAEPGYLNWSELQRDLLLSAQHTGWLYIFSLEGCMRQGFIPRLLDFDWTQPVTLPGQQLRRVQRVRAALRPLLWASAHPGAVLAGGAAVLWAVLTLRRKRRGR